jgi:hypothetical protein
MTEEDPVEEIEEMVKEEKPKEKARTAPAKKKKSTTKKAEAGETEEPKARKQIVYKKIKVRDYMTKRLVYINNLSTKLKLDGFPGTLI